MICETRFVTGGVCPGILIATVFPADRTGAGDRMSRATGSSRDDDGDDAGWLGVGAEPLSRRDLGRDRRVGQGLRCGVPEREAWGCTLE